MKRFIVLTAALVGSAAFPVDASAYASLLEAQAFPGACGGSVGCGILSDTTVTDPAANAVVTATQNDVRLGNAAHAYALTSFGTQKVYADAYATTGYAETSAYSSVQDIIPASEIVGGIYTIHFNISGAFTDTTGISGASGGGYLYVNAVDNTTNYGLGSLNWFSTAAAPGGLVDFAVTVPADHSIRLRVDFTANAYTSSSNSGAVYGPLLVVADFSHSLNYYFSAPAGGTDLIGVSGHDYSVNPLSAVPEPATWTMMLAGVVAVGVAGRRRARQAAVAA